MSKRVILGAAVKAIRTAKAASDPTKVPFDPADLAGSRFCIKAGMSHAHLCNIEAGRKQPPEDVIHRIAALLGVPVDAISYTVATSAEAVA